MKIYLNKLNARIDSLVEALKQAEDMITKQTSKKNLEENIAGIANNNEQLGNGSIADCFQ